MRLGAVALLLLPLILCGGVATAHAAAPGAAASLDRARQHFLAGKRAFETGNYDKALREFQDGYALEPRPGFLLNMGHAARRLKQLPEARDFYLKYLATHPMPGDESAARQMLAEIDRELPPEAGAPSGMNPPYAALADVTPAPIAVSPVDLRARPEAAPATLAGAPAPASGGEGAPIYRRWWFWAGVGAAAAGVATAIAIGASGSSARDSGSWGQLKL